MPINSIRVVDSMESVSTRQYVSPLLKVERIRELFFYLIIFILVVIIGLMVKKIWVINGSLEKQSDVLYRTEENLIQGGKRFIDYIYSINSATIHYDRFRAIEMLINDEDKITIKRNLEEHDIVREVQNLGIRSHIDWSQYNNTILSKSDDNLTVEYKGYLVVNSHKHLPFNMILTLQAVEKSSLNNDGVGIKKYRDVALNPFNSNSGINDE